MRIYRAIDYWPSNKAKISESHSISTTHVRTRSAFIKVCKCPMIFMPYKGSVVVICQKRNFYMCHRIYSYRWPRRDHRRIPLMWCTQRRIYGFQLKLDRIKFLRVSGRCSWWNRHRRYVQGNMLSKNVIICCEMTLEL